MTALWCVILALLLASSSGIATDKTGAGEPAVSAPDGYQARAGWPLTKDFYGHLTDHELTLTTYRARWSAPGSPVGEYSVPYESAETYQGIASQGAAYQGRDYLAMREHRGTRARLCGAGGCWTGTVNDYGPSKRLFPERVADIGIVHWIHVCGLEPRLGTCPVTVTILSRPHGATPTGPPTDTEGG